MEGKKKEKKKKEEKKSNFQKHSYLTLLCTCVKAVQFYYPSNKVIPSYWTIFSYISLCVKVEKEQTQKSQEKAYCDLHEHARLLKNFSEFT